MDTIELSKYVVLGNVDAGKSTFIGVMKNRELDNGKGSARSSIVRLKHEADFGRTSSHSFHYLTKNNEVTTLIDLCGHEKYFKTTLFGVMGLFCDFGLIIVAANAGVTGMSKEHMSLLMHLKIPFMIIITKVDLCPANILIDTKKQIERILKTDKRNQREIIHVDEPSQDISDKIKTDFEQNKMTTVPVITTSNKTGKNIDLVRDLITSIKVNNIQLQNNPVDESNYPPIFFIDNTFSVAGVGLVLSGIVKYGSIKIGDSLFVGPLDSRYIPITVKSIHNCVSQNIDVLNANTSGSIAIRLDNKRSYSRRMFHKGQIATPNLEFAMNHTCRNMNCTVGILDHPTTIKNGYQTVIHCITIRQSAIFSMDEGKYLRSGSKEDIGVRFFVHAEFVLPGSLFMFRDGRTKGIGRVNSIVPMHNDKWMKKKPI